MNIKDMDAATYMRLVTTLSLCSLVALALIAIPICIVLCVFMKNHPGPFVEIIKSHPLAEVLKIFTVFAVIFAICLMAAAHIVEGASIVAVLSSIAGYVLGGLNERKRSDVGKTAQEPESLQTTLETESGHQVETGG